MLFGLTEEAQVKLGAGENQVFADKSFANKRKKTGEMCLAPIFYHNSQKEFLFSFNGQIFIYFDSLTGKFTTRLSRKFQSTVNGFLLWHSLFYDFYYPVKFIKNNSDNSNDDNDSTTDE